MIIGIKGNVQIIEDIEKLMKLFFLKIQVEIPIIESRVISTNKLHPF